MTADAKNMLKGNLKFSSAVVLAILLGTVAPAPAAWLITPDEAVRLQTPAADVEQPASAVEGPGPLIVVRNPKVFEPIRSPLDIFVAFEPGNSGLPAAMETLLVKLIGLFDIDISDRVRRYVSGNNLIVTDAELPAGNHRLRILIKDIVGNSNERDIVLKVITE